MSKHVLRQRTQGWTTASNKVIDTLQDDPFALGIYIGLLRLPDDWEFYKTELCKRFKCGIKKLEKALKRLKLHGLIEYGQERNDKGQFERFTLEIFDTEQPKTQNQKLQEPDGHFCRTVKTVRRFGEATKEEITKEKINKQKREAKNERTLSQDEINKTFVNEEIEKICAEKNLDVMLEFKKFLNHFDKKEITCGMFENWIIRARCEKKSKNVSEENSIDRYVSNLMKDTGMSEEEARQYYRNKGVAA